jgi:hypothetical protein
MRNVVFWDMAPCGFIIKDVSEERAASVTTHSSETSVIIHKNKGGTLEVYNR